MKSACNIQFISINRKMEKYQVIQARGNIAHYVTTQQLAAQFRFHAENSASLTGLRITVPKELFSFSRVLHHIMTRNRYLARFAKACTCPASAKATCRKGVTSPTGTDAGTNNCRRNHLQPRSRRGKCVQQMGNFTQREWLATSVGLPEKE